MDVELRALEERLIDRHDFVVLREPGIAACPRCSALHGSDANFCPNCGLGLDGPQAISEVGDAPATAPTGHLSVPMGTATPAPAGGAAPPPAAGSAPPPRTYAVQAPPPASGPVAPAPPGGAGSVHASESGTTPVSSGLWPLTPEPPTTVQPATGGEPPTRVEPAAGGEPPAAAKPAVKPDPEPGRSPDAP